MTPPAAGSGVGGRNIAATLPAMALQQPHTLAVAVPFSRDPVSKAVAWTHLTYAQLDLASDRIAAGLQALGVGPGVRTVLMVKPSLEFFALTFGLFKSGAVPVLVDPGMGRRRLGACLAEAEPEAFVGIPVAHVARLVLGWARRSLRTFVTVGRGAPWGGVTLEQVKAEGARRLADGWRMADAADDDMAAVLFTSGATGLPKGAEYRHGTFQAQVAAIRAAYDIRPGEIDLPTFPLFALFDPALGMTTIVPDMDFARPAAVDPERIYEAVLDWGVTNLFGSPALLDTVSRHGVAHGVHLPTLRRVITAGAPVSPAILERMAALLPADARIHTPYGATECLPVASIDHTVVLGELRSQVASGAGVCVGRVVDPATVAIVPITDDPMPTWTDDLALPPGEPGEIVVRGPQVSRAYLHRPEATAQAKIADPTAPGGVRHRMGDVGVLDADGRLWFHGRKAHRLQTAQGVLLPVPVEMVFNAVPGVRRTALVGVGLPGAQVAVLCVELEPGVRLTLDALRPHLDAAAARHPPCRTVRHFLLHPGFPVDIRHNAKIDRPALAVWASTRIEA